MMNAPCRNKILVVYDGAPYINQALLLADFGHHVYVLPASRKTRRDKIEKSIKEISDEADALLSAMFEKDTRKK
jgi:hypothetical protein